jgi:hypothetical protein
MNRSLWKSLGITVVLLAVAGIAMAAAALPPRGTICVKPANMTHIFRLFGSSNAVFAATSGQITAQVGQSVQTAQTKASSGFTFRVLDFKSSGTVTGLGDVLMTLDTSRTPEPSTFLLNASGQDYTQRINIFLNVDVNGKTYRSAGQVTLLGTAVQTFPPSPGTSYSLTTKVQLVDSANQVVYELPPGQAATIL